MRNYDDTVRDTAAALDPAIDSMTRLLIRHSIPSSRASRSATLDAMREALGSAGEIVETEERWGRTRVLVRWHAPGLAVSVLALVRRAIRHTDPAAVLLTMQLPEGLQEVA